MIKKIIVELGDKEATFAEFDSVQSFLDSELYKTETATVIEATPVEPVKVEVPVEPVVAEPTAEPAK